jgi:hypothetical protein
MTRLVALSIAALFVAIVAHSSRAQVVPPIGGIGFFGGGNGVYLDPDGTLHQRQTDTAGDLAVQRLRAKALNQPPKAQAMTYVSLPRLLAQVRELAEQKKELPDDVRYLSGLTQLRYVFVYPAEHDVVLAGTSEPYDAASRNEPHGKLTGRPVLHLDDLVMALRNPGAFGCSLDPHPDSLNRSNQVMRDLANSTRAARMKGLKEAIGPQQVRLIGRMPADTRMAFVAVAADYKLKRLVLGLDPMPVPGVGSPVDNTRAAGNRFWFEASYAPLLVSPDNDAYELRGPRLTLKAGAFSFDPKGATETSKTFAKNFSAKLPQLATVVPLFADLQNVSDLAVVASLIRKDRLDQKAGLDLAWITSEANYPISPIPTPKQAETLVNYTNGSIVAGGVLLDTSPVVAETAREPDTKNALKPVRSRPTGERWARTDEGTTAGK